MSPKAGEDGCGKSRFHRNSIPDRPARKVFVLENGLCCASFRNRKGRVESIT